MELPLIVTPLAAILGLLAAAVLSRSVLNADPGSKRMQEISDAVKDGAMAFMNRQYKTIAVVAAIITAILLVVSFVVGNTDEEPWTWITVGFVIGALFSAASGYIGMNIAVRANVRVAHAAAQKNGLKGGLDIAFKGGAVSGLAVAGLALLGVAGFYYYFAEVAEMHNPVAPLVGYAFGASLISLFARVGGGIYTKAADVGADLVGKVEAGIPEDDPRNPAVIADNVGDNVGDCAGMGADLFETYAVTVVAAVFLGYLLPGSITGALVTYPLFLGAFAMISSIIGVYFVKLGKDENIMKALYRGVYASVIVSAIGFWWLTTNMLGDFDFAAHGIVGLAGREVTATGLFLASMIGLLVTLLMMFITEYYTSTEYRPVKATAKASETGSATNIISGLAVGMESTFAPVVVIAIAMFGAFAFGGLYGIAIAAVAMLGITGCLLHELLGVDALYPTGGLGGAAPPTIF